MSQKFSDSFLVNGGSSQPVSEDGRDYGQPIKNLLAESLANEVSKTLDWPDEKKSSDAIGVPAAAPPTQPPPSTPPPVTTKKTSVIVSPKSPPIDEKLQKLKARCVRWVGTVVDAALAASFKEDIITAKTADELDIKYTAAKKAQKSAKEKVMRQEKKLLALKQKETQSKAENGVDKMKTDASDEDEDDDGEEEDAGDATDTEDGIETDLKKAYEKLAKPTNTVAPTAAAVAAAGAGAPAWKSAEHLEIIKQLMQPRTPAMASESSADQVTEKKAKGKRGRAKADEDATETAKRSKEIPKADAKAAATAAIQPPPPPPPPRLDILCYVLGTKFVERVAQALVDKGAQSIVGTLEQQSYLANLADSMISLARPDLADEANDVTSKSSSVADKETVRAIRLVNKLPREFTAALQAKRLSQIASCKPSREFDQIIGFSSLAASNVVLNAYIAVSAEKTRAAIATALAEYSKHQYALAMRPLIEQGVMPSKLIDVELEATSRLVANRYTIIECKESDMLMTNSAMHGTPTSANQPAQKRVRIDERRNTTSSAPLSNPSALLATATTPPLPPPPPSPFVMPLTLIGAFGLSIADNERVFKYDVTQLLKDRYSGGVTILPNATMMALFSMLHVAYNTPEEVQTLLAPQYKDHARAMSSRPRDKIQNRPTNRFASFFSACADVLVPDLQKAYYDANPDVPRTVHEFVIQWGRQTAENYISNAEHEVTKKICLVDLPIAHILFGFLRMDARLAHQRVGEPAFHPSGRVVSSAKDRAGTEVLLSVNELPVGVSVRSTDIMKRVLMHQWNRWLTHLGLADAKGKLVAGASEKFLAAYEAAKYGEHQWMVDYFKKSFVPSAEQRILFREAMVPVMFAIFPPPFMGRVTDNK